MPTPDLTPGKPAFLKEGVVGVGARRAGGVYKGQVGLIKKIQLLI